MFSIILLNIEVVNLVLKKPVFLQNFKKKSNKFSSFQKYKNMFYFVCIWPNSKNIYVYFI